MRSWIARADAGHTRFIRNAKATRSPAVVVQ